MSGSVVSCAFMPHTTALVRVKPSSGSGYVVSTAKRFPFGLVRIAADRDGSLLAKIGKELQRWHDDLLALNFTPPLYRSLPAFLPSDATPEEQATYQRLEASNFLHQPNSYWCSALESAEPCTASDFQAYFLLYYPAEPLRMVRNALSAHCALAVCSTPVEAFCRLTVSTQDVHILLEIEEAHVALAVAHQGKLMRFVCHPIHRREEREYFALRELLNTPACRDHVVQVSGSHATKNMLELLRRETGLSLRLPTLPAPHFVTNSTRQLLTEPDMYHALSAAMFSL
uniref:DUF3822 family protein n=1 Tax=Chlorobium chlorochromatii (strain CaD3) TaxID=340177 RepID=Q3AQ48_CHLCH